MKHHPKGWGSLNLAMNKLVQTNVIEGYSTSSDEAGVVTVKVTVEAGADQAEVVRQVRAALPESFSDAQVQTETRR